jgi:hypothetical protein
VSLPFHKFSSSAMLLLIVGNLKVWYIVHNMFHENWSTGPEVKRWDIQYICRQHGSLVKGGTYNTHADSMAVL